MAEDWARFGLNRRDLVAALKDLRQQLGSCHLPSYRQARHTASDSAAGLGHPAQAQRLDSQAVVAANCARAQEALRVLEEFGRASNPGHHGGKGGRNNGGQRADHRRGVEGALP